MDPKNKTRRNTDCRPEDFFPEVCYPKNDPFWKRLTVCDDQGDPCELDLTGLRKPNATPSREVVVDPGVIVGNDEFTVGCPESYLPLKEDQSVTVPADQFVRFVADSRDTQAQEDAKQIVNNLAQLFAQTQLNCYAENEAQTVNCDATHSINGGTNNLVANPDDSATVAANTVRVKLDSVTVVADQEARLALTSASVSEDDFVVQLDEASPNFYEVTGFAGGTAQYAAPVDASTAYAALHVTDLGEANATALSQAYARLDCVYGNPAAADLNCPNDTDGVAALTDQGTDSVPVSANMLTYRIGDVQAGAPYPTSPDQTDLDPLVDQARLQAVTQLRCVWWSKQVVAKCPTVDSGTSACSGSPVCNGDPVDVPFGVSVTRPQTSLTPIAPTEFEVRRGQSRTVLTFDDPDLIEFDATKKTQAELTEEATTLLAAITQCRYGNDEFASVATCCDDLDTTINDLANVEKNFTTCESSTLTAEQQTDLSGPPTLGTTQNPGTQTRTTGPTKTGDWTPAVAEGTSLEIAADSFILTHDVALIADDDLQKDAGASDAQKDVFDVLPAKPQAAKDEADNLASSLVCEPLAVCLWGNDPIVAAHCEPESAESAGEEQPYQVGEPSEAVPENMFIGTEGKWQVQELAILFAKASRVCVPKEMGNKAVTLTCPKGPDTPNESLFYEEGSVEPAIVAETYFAPTECLATQLAVDIAFATRLCAYGNVEVTAANCPDVTLSDGTTASTTAAGGLETLESYFVLEYGAIADPNETAETFVNALRQCVVDATGGEFEEEGTCELKLTGSFSRVGSGGTPDPTSIAYSVTGGSIKSNKSDAVTTLSSVGPAQWTIQHPHFYVSFPIDASLSPVDGSTATVISIATKQKNEFYADTDTNTGYLYIGSFTGFPEYQGTNDIVTEGTLCAEGVYEYSLGGVENINPLQIISGSASNKFRITPGRVNGVTPTLGGTAIDAETPPEITVTEDTWVWLKCVGTFGSPDTYVVTVETSSTSVVPAGTDISATGFVSFYLIGDVDFTSGSPDTYEITNDHGGGNLGVDSWGLYNLWWRA